MNLKDEETNMLCYFVFIGIAVKNRKMDIFPKNLKFVFSLIVSKNKTERLIETFMLVEERFRDIEILSEPFIQDENLIVKVLDMPKDKSLKKVLM